MEDESLHVRYLILITAILCAVIIGYNAFYVPEADILKVSVKTDIVTSVVSNKVVSEEYVPQVVTSSQPADSSSNFASSKVASFGNSSKHKNSSRVKNSHIQGKININTATAKQLSEGLTGIGDTLAGRIVAYREQNGNFKSIEEIKKVSGIAEKKFKNIREVITI